ncbi:MAG: Bax inhibitor-1 family protein [Cocleimonas sp.]|nr:Bax inhibitor-1 family protein [Cocleimonas sp.]
MSHFDAGTGQIVANAAESERASFIKRTYLHVAGALGTLALLEYLLISSGVGSGYMQTIVSLPFYHIGAFVLFMIIATVANKWAHSGVSRELQYVGLGVYVTTLALYFLPVLYIASSKYPGIITHAFLVTSALVAGITFTAFTSKVNFSFLGKYLKVGLFVLIGVVISGWLFGFSLGLWLTGAAMLIFGGFVLYDTSNIIHEYHTEQYVGASLALSSSIAFLFIYVVQFFMGMGDD